MLEANTIPLLSISNVLAPARVELIWAVTTPLLSVFPNKMDSAPAALLLINTLLPETSLILTGLVGMGYPSESLRVMWMV